MVLNKNFKFDIRLLRCSTSRDGFLIKCTTLAIFSSGGTTLVVNDWLTIHVMLGTSESKHCFMTVAGSRMSGHDFRFTDDFSDFTFGC